MNEIDISNFDKSKLKINIPSQTKDGQFSKMTYGNFPIVVQTPVSLTKQGITKHGKKMVCDLMFKTIETEFLNWFEQLESAAQSLLHEKADDWFEQKLELTDIENLFTTPVKLFKSGKYYLIRASLKDPIKIFKENDNILELTYSDIVPESNIISLLEVKGIKYTNKDFQFDIEIKQIMIVSSDPFLENCFIKIKKTAPPEIPVNLGNRVIDLDNMVNSLIDNEIKIDQTEINIDHEIKIQDIPELETKLEDLKIDSIELDSIESELTEMDINPIKITNEKEYTEIYLKAKQEAEEAKNRAVDAYLKLEEIRLKYNIDDSDEENL
jgi:hypothetical protein